MCWSMTNEQARALLERPITHFECLHCGGWQHNPNVKCRSCGADQFKPFDVARIPQ